MIAGRFRVVALLGRGGKGLFSLNVTEPTQFGAGDLLWDYSAGASSSGASDRDLGLMLGRPVVTALNNGKDLNQSDYEKECKHLDEIAWYHNNSGKQAHPVGLKKPNAWGLHDMHGNVGEWCDDLYRPYPYGQNIPETNPEYAEFRSYRGGAWTWWAKGCRSASRYRYATDYFDHDLGFRPALRPVAK